MPGTYPCGTGLYAIVKHLLKKPSVNHFKGNIFHQLAGSPAKGVSIHGFRRARFHSRPRIPAGLEPADVFLLPTLHQFMCNSGDPAFSKFFCAEWLKVDQN